MKRVLYVCHNHPAQRPGGAEIYAMELYESVRQAREFQPIMVAKTGTPVATGNPRHQGTRFSLADEDPNVYLMYTQRDEIDMIFGTAVDKRLYTKHLRAFLKAIRPDIVHVHHTMFFGYDILREIRNTLPDAPIVYTLHEFMPICHRQGQMLRVADDTPCMKSSPLRCHTCFPEISQQTFFMRKRFIQSHLSLVDLFIAPSAFLGERYIDWGIPREKVLVEEYGRTPPAGEAGHDGTGTHRNRFGFFGQLTPYKGLQVLLEAATLLQEDARTAEDPLLEAIVRLEGRR